MDSILFDCPDLILQVRTLRPKENVPLFIHPSTSPSIQPAHLLNYSNLINVIDTVLDARIQR